MKRSHPESCIREHWPLPARPLRGIPRCEGHAARAAQCRAESPVPA